MKLFNNKIIQKIIITMFLIILLFEVTIPSISKADYTTYVKNSAKGYGGVLFEPIRTLLLLLGDAATTGLNFFVWGIPVSVLYLEKIYTGQPEENVGETIWSMFETYWNVATSSAATMLDPTGTLNNAKRVYMASLSGIDFFEEIQLPVFLVTPERIFSNKIPLLDVNLINPHNYSSEGVDQSAASILQPIVSSWYNALRTIATVGFMLVLVYIGIRIIISSTAADKSKYKQMLKDWLIGLCLLYTMHFIMAGVLYITEKVTDLFDNNAINITIDDKNVDLNDYPGVDMRYGISLAYRNQFVNMFNNNPEGDTQLLSWNTDLTGYTRFMAQPNIGSISITVMIVYTVMYIVLVIYTYIFLFKYLKRLLNMILLTLIAPVVSFTYPLDKLADGSAQAFNTWLKEYIYNLLIQPVHLILYTVFIGSAQSLVVDHPIYAIVAMGFLLQAEKFIRKLFRFDSKASITGAAATGAFTGAVVMKGIESAVKLASKKGGSAPKGGKVEGGNNNIRTNKNIERKPDDSSETQKLMDEAISIKDLDNVPDNRELPKNSNPSTGDENVSGENPSLDGVDVDFSGENPSLDGVDVDFSGENPSQDKVNVDLSSENPKDNMPKKEIKKPTYSETARKYYGKKIGKGVGKFALKALTAGTLGTIGFAAGLASDDFSNVLKYGAAGIAGGALLGNSALNLPGQISNAIRSDKEEIIKQQYANDPKGYTQYLNEKFDKEWKNSKEAQQKYIEAFGIEKYKKMMELAKKYREHGITDDELIIRAMKEKNSLLGNNMASKERIAMAKLASRVSNPKDIESIEKDLKRKLSKQVDSKNLDNEKREEIRQKIPNQVDNYVDAIKGISGFKFL